MMSVYKDLAMLELPQAFSADAAEFEDRRREILALLAQEEYGVLPGPADGVEYEVIPGERMFGGGTAEAYQVRITVRFGGRSHSFPLYCMIPTASRPCPAFLLVNFRPGIPDAYLPAEEIADNGFAVFSLCYNDVTKDNDDFTDGLAGLLYQGRVRGASDPGKISMWAWAAMRAMDYIQTLVCIDKRNIGIVGHSRLGKTALWAAANDARFSFIFANESGCGGSSLARGTADDAEHVSQICDAFSYWFCEAYQAYAGHEKEMPFDQHFLLSTLAPRRLYIALAEGDLWTDPKSSYRACFAAAKAYETLGVVPAFTGQDAYPKTGDVYHDGAIGFHMRSGDHFLSRRDWLGFMAYFKRYLRT